MNFNYVFGSVGFTPLHVKIENHWLQKWLNPFFPHISLEVAKVGDGNITTEKRVTGRATFVEKYSVQSVMSQTKGPNTLCNTLLLLSWNSEEFLNKEHSFSPLSISCYIWIFVHNGREIFFNWGPFSPMDQRSNWYLHKKREI